MKKQKITEIETNDYILRLVNYPEVAVLKTKELKYVLFKPNKNLENEEKTRENKK